MASSDLSLASLVFTLESSSEIFLGLVYSINEFNLTVSSSIVALETAAETAVDSAALLQETAERFAWKVVVSPNPVLVGDTLTFTGQGIAALKPTLSVYNHKNAQIVNNIEMTEDTENPGNYSYELKVNASQLEPGQAYTFVLTEETTGGLVAGSGFVESVSLTAVAGLASAAPAAEKAAREALEAIRELEAKMATGGDLRKALLNLEKEVEELPNAILLKSEGKDKRMKAQMNEMAMRLQQLAGSQGLDLSQMFTKAIDESSTIQDIHGRSNEIQAAVSVISDVVEQKLGGTDEVIQATFFES